MGVPWEFHAVSLTHQINCDDRVQGGLLFNVGPISIEGVVSMMPFKFILIRKVRICWKSFYAVVGWGAGDLCRKVPEIDGPTLLVCVVSFFCSRAIFCCWL